LLKVESIRLSEAKALNLTLTRLKFSLIWRISSGGMEERIARKELAAWARSETVGSQIPLELRIADDAA
jgi:hypothetical protein